MNQPEDTQRRFREGPAVRICLYATALMALVYVPAFAYPYVVPRAVFFRTLIAVGLLGLLHAVLTGSGRFQARHDWILWGFGAFVAVSAIAGLSGVAPTRSFFGSFTRMWGVWAWLHLFCAYVLFRTFFRSRDWIRFFRLVVVVSVFSGIYAIFQRLPGLALFPVLHAGTTRPDGLLGNPGYLSAFLLWAIGVCGFLVSTERGRRTRWAYGGSATFLLVVMVLTQTRAAILAAVVASLAIVVLSVRLIPHRRRLLLGLAGAAVLLLAIGGTLALRASAASDSAEVSGTMRRFVRPGLQTGSIGMRMYTWGAGWDAWPDRPLLGYGPENFFVAFNRHFPPGYYDTETWAGADRAHNSYLEALVSSGVLGLAAYLAFWIAVFMALGRAYRQGRLSAGATLALSWSLIAYLIYLFFWFEDHTSISLGIAIVAFVANCATDKPLYPIAGRRARRWQSTVVGLFGVVVVGAIVWIHGVQVLRAAHSVKQAVTDTDFAVEERLALFERALDTGVPQRYEILGEYQDLLEALVPQAESIRTDAYRAEIVLAAIERGLDEVSVEIARDPLNPRPRTVKAGIAISGLFIFEARPFFDIAYSALEEARRLGPTRIRTYHQIAMLYAAVGRYDRAVQSLDEARRVYEDFGETDYYEARVHLERGDLDRALESAHAALDRDYAERPSVARDLLRTLMSRGRWSDAAEYYCRYRAVQALPGPAGGLERQLRALDGEELGLFLELRHGLLRSTGPAGSGPGLPRCFLPEPDRDDGA